MSGLLVLKLRIYHNFSNALMLLIIVYITPGNTHHIDDHCTLLYTYINVYVVYMYIVHPPHKYPINYKCLLEYFNTYITNKIGS